jgi:hypothetical protein
MDTQRLSLITRNISLVIDKYGIFPVLEAIATRLAKDSETIANRPPSPITRKMSDRLGNAAKNLFGIIENYHK